MTNLPPELYSAYSIPGIDRKLVVDMPEKIIEDICEMFNIPTRKITYRFKGTLEVIYARDWIIWFLIQRTNFSLKRIGEILGGRDHTTIIYAREKVRDRLYNDKSGQYAHYQTDYERIKNKIHYLPVRQQLINNSQSHVH